MSDDQKDEKENEESTNCTASDGNHAPSTPPVPRGTPDDSHPTATLNPTNPIQHQHPPPPSMPPLYHPYPPHPPSTGHYGPYSAVIGKPGNAYHRPPPPGQGPPPQSTVASGSHLSSPRRNYDREDHNFHIPVPVRPNEAEYCGPYSGGNYGAPQEDRRWMVPETSSHYQAHSYPPNDGQMYPKGHPQAYHPPPPLPPHPIAPGHMAYHYPHAPYPGNRYNDKSRMPGHPIPNATESYGEANTREGATSPSQIEMSHRDEVTSMGCTCKKTKCLKLYCQCFAVKIYCGPNCRCLVCFNTTNHEQARKDAMRSILTRNPTAFDTKFSKTKEKKTKEEHTVLAHKLGCKCRKSACMKKYCECYAGNVKCSPNCRCIGCKNTSSAKFGPGKPDDEGSIVSYDLPPPHGGRKGREPWMMNAAHNLAFLKHGSPTVEKITTFAQDAGEVASMPSLAASSSDSPEEKGEDTTKAATVKNGESNGPVNSLLIAAMAMTEFQSRKDEASAIEDKRRGDKESSLSMPKDIEDRKGLRPSPKRKTSDRVKDTDPVPETASEEVAASNAKSQEQGTEDSVSPLDPRELKRTRLGSVQKTTTLEQPETPDAIMKDKAMSGDETPKPKGAGTDTLTPISARCIDFKKIHF